MRRTRPAAPTGDPRHLLMPSWRGWTASPPRSRGALGATIRHTVAWGGAGRRPWTWRPSGAALQLVERRSCGTARAPPQATYTFKHALIPDAAYESLLQGPTAVPPAHCPGVDRALPGDRRTPARSVDGTTLPLTMLALVLVATSGTRTPSNAQRIARPSRPSSKLSALQRLPEQRETREQAIRSRAPALGIAPSTGSGRVPAVLREAESRGGPRRPSAPGTDLGILARHFYLMGASDQAITTAQRALALATTGGDIVLHARQQAKSWASPPRPRAISSGRLTASGPERGGHRWGAAP